MNIEEEKQRLNQLYKKTETIPPQQPLAPQQYYPQQPAYPQQPQRQPLPQPVPQYQPYMRDVPNFDRPVNLKDIFKLADRIDKTNLTVSKWSKIISFLVVTVILLILISTNIIPLG